MNSAKDFTNTAQPKGTLMGVIEDAIRKNQADYRQQQLETQHRNDERKFLQAKAEREAKEERIKTMNELAGRLIARLAPVVLDALQKQNYPQAQLSRRFTKKVRYFGFFGPLVKMFDREEYAFWKMRDGNKQSRVVVLRRDGICHVGISQHYNPRQRYNAYVPAYIVPKIYEILRHFAIRAVRIDEAVINRIEKPFKLSADAKLELGITQAAPEPVERWGH